MLAVAGALAAAVLAGPAAARPVGTSAPPPDWVDCGGGFQCATYQVPVDYRRPSAGTMGIAMTRLPASDPARRIGSLFVNPGGPGASGVAFVRGGARFYYTPAVRARFDIVGFDPRGVGGSGYLQCFADAAQQQAFWGASVTYPLTRAEEQPYVRLNARYSALCHQRNGNRLDHVSTVDVARDLDRMRAAVGDAKLTYVGYSYGSYLGTVYANLFPNRVRAVALDGVIDPELWANQSGRMLADAAYGGEETLDAFAGSCAAAGTACAFDDGDDAAAIRHRMDVILAGLKDDPLPAPGADPPGELDYFMGNGAYLLSMYDTFFWPGFAAGLTQAEGGDGTILLDFIRQFLAVPPGVYDNSGDLWSSVVCSDGTFPKPGAVWPALVRLSELRAPTFSRQWWYTTLACATWAGRAPDRYAGPWNRHTSAPVLLMTTAADPATPSAGAIRTRSRLADARLVVVQGWGHTTTAHPSACAQQAFDRYVIEQVAPAGVLRCTPDVQPFDVGLAARSATIRPPVPWLVPPLAVPR